VRDGTKCTTAVPTGQLDKLEFLLPNGNYIHIFRKYGRELSKVVATFVEKYKDYVYDDLLNLVLAVRSCMKYIIAQEYIIAAQVLYCVKERKDVIIQLD